MQKDSSQNFWHQTNDNASNHSKGLAFGKTTKPVAIIITNDFSRTTTRINKFTQIEDKNMGDKR